MSPLLLPLLLLLTRSSTPARRALAARLLFHHQYSSSNSSLAQAAQAAAAGLPPQAQRSLAESAVALGVVAGAGRALVARRPVAHGQVLLEEAPIAAFPSPDFAGRQCYHCLRPLGEGDDQDEQETFCADACRREAERSYWRLEQRASSGFAALRSHCARERERFPLVAARLACSVLQAWQDGEEGEAAAEDDALLAVGPMPALSYLCYANVGSGEEESSNSLPPAWRTAHALLAQAVGELLPKAQEEEEEDDDDEESAAAAGRRGRRRPLTPAVIAAVSSPQWYGSVLSRLHLNSFRVESAAAGDGGGLLAAAAAASAAATEAPSSSSFAEALLRAAAAPPVSRALGSAVYSAASLANHSCDPTADAAWPRACAAGGDDDDGGGASRLRLTARRDLSPGEEVTITYIDASLPVEERRRMLLHGYGFLCQCARCGEEAAAAAQRGGGEDLV